MTLKRPGLTSILVLALALGGLAQAQVQIQQLRALNAAGLAPASETQRQQRLDEARLALSRGEADAALLPLDAAAAMSHAADTEMLQLQALLQRGRVRHALAFAAHMAAAHRDTPEARSLHVWLLALAGQPAHAASQLAAMPLTDSALNADFPAALSALEQPAALGAGMPGPWPHGVDVPATSRPIATGLLLEGGALALVPAAVLRGGGPVWLRNGLGRASQATPAATDPALAEAGLALLRVEPALVATTPLQRAPRAAFAGSPALRVATLRIDSAAAAWPLMQAGFLGRMDREGRQALGWPGGATVGGGPVFDAAGRLIGLALPGPDGHDRLLPVSQLAPLQALAVATDARPRMHDEVYEAALPWVAQVLSPMP